jgi:hypothetical protein
MLRTADGLALQLQVMGYDSLMTPPEHSADKTSRMLEENV